MTLIDLSTPIAPGLFSPQRLRSVDELDATFRKLGENLTTEELDVIGAEIHGFERHAWYEARCISGTHAYALVFRISAADKLIVGFPYLDEGLNLEQHARTRVEAFTIGRVTASTIDYIVSALNNKIKLHAERPH